MVARYLITPPSEHLDSDPLPALINWTRHQLTIGVRRLEVDVRLVKPESSILAAITCALQVARERQAELVVGGASALWHATLERLGLDTLGLRWTPPPMPIPPPGLSQPGRWQLPPDPERSIVQA